MFAREIRTKKLISFIVLLLLTVIGTNLIVFDDAYAAAPSVTSYSATYQNGILEASLTGSSDSVQGTFVVYYSTKQTPAIRSTVMGQCLPDGVPYSNESSSEWRFLTYFDDATKPYSISKNIKSSLPSDTKWVVVKFGVINSSGTWDINHPLTGKMDAKSPTAPTINITSPAGYTTGSVNQNVKFTITHGTDGETGVQKSQYRLNSDSWRDYTSEVTISTAGQTTIFARTIDKAGNISPEASRIVKIDNTAPRKPVIQKEVTRSNGTIDVTLGSADGGRIYYTLNGKDPKDAWNEYITDGGTINITSACTLNARVWQNNQWSDLLTKYIYTNEDYNKPRKPVVSREAEKSNGTKDITLGSADGGRIYYTLNGKDPIDAWNEYVTDGGTINITSSSTLKARVWQNNKWSDLLEQYVYVREVSTKPKTPVILKETIRSNGTVDITLGSADGGRIYYTLNSKDPIDAWNEYVTDGSTINITSTCLLNVRVWQNNQWSDLLAKYIYVNEVSTKPRTPVINRETERSNGTIDVTLGSADGGRIYYTLNGKDPIDAWNEYVTDGDTINVTSSGTLKARVWQNNKWSDLLEKYVYVREVSTKPKTPVILKETIRSNGTVDITLGSADGGRIYYTLNSKDPIDAWNEYVTDGGTINITSTCLLNVRVWQNNQWSHLLAKYIYVNEVSTKPRTPVINRETERSNGTIDITLGSSDGGRIYYTLNGKDPMDAWNEYITDGGTINITSNSTLKARVWQNNQWSDLLERSFYVTESGNRPRKPELVDEKQISKGRIEVTLRSRDGGRIYYTKNGKDPKDQKYDYITTGDTLEIYSDEILKARVWQNNQWSDILEVYFDSYKDEVEGNIAVPRFSKSAGKYDSPITIRIYCEDADAKIYYTINGKDPKLDKDKSEYMYDGDRLEITKTSTILARAYKNREWSKLTATVYEIGQTSPAPAALESDDSEEDLLKIARELYGDKEYDEAIEVLDHLLGIYEDSEEGIVLLADCYVAKNQRTTAYNKLKEFISSYEKPLAVNRYAEICISQNKSSEAKKVLLSILPEYSKETYLYKTFTYAQDQLNQRQINIFVYGNEVNFARYDNVYPELVNGRTLVPIRAITEAMGANVNWNSDKRIATIELDGDTIELADGYGVARVNGKTVTLDVSAQIFGQRLMVPLRFVSENFGKSVDWYEVGKGRTVSVNELKKF